MSVLGSVVVTLTAVTSGLKRGLTDAQNQLQDLQKTVQATTDNFKTIGQGAMVAGTAIATGLGFAVMKAGDFEAKMSRVQALSGATTEELAQMRDTAMSLGSSTSFSASQVADGMSMLAMAGYKTNEVIQAMPGLLATASAGQIDLATTSDIVSNILSGFGIQASETGKVADILAYGFTNANTTLTELGYAMKYVGPVAKSAGMSLEETTAAIGLLSNAGIKGEQAGTTLRGVIASLLDPSKEVAKKMNELGIKTVDATGKMVPLHDIVGQFQRAFKNMGEAQKTATASMIVGREASAGFLTLLDAGQDTILQFTKELENSGGTADRIAKTQMNNLKGSWTELMSVVETLAINIGNVLIPAVRAVVDFFKALIDKVNNMNPSLRDTITIILAVASGLLLVGGAMALAIGYFPSIIAGLKAISGALLFLVTNPVGLWITAIGILVTGAITLYTAWTKNMGGIQTKTGAVGRYLVALFNDVVTKIATAFNTLKSKVFSLLQGIMNAVSPVIGAIGKVAPGIEDLFNKAKNAVAKESADIQVKLSELAVKAEHTGTQLDIAGQQVKRAFSSWETPAKNASKSAKILTQDMSQVGKGLENLVVPSDLVSKGVSNAGSAFDDLAKEADKASEKQKKAKKEKSELASTVEVLGSKLNLLKAQFEISMARLGENADESKKLNNELYYLRLQYEHQKKIVEEARLAYENMKKTKGELHKDTVESAQKYAQEAKSLADLSKKIADTEVALARKAWRTAEAKSRMEVLNAEYEKAVASLGEQSGKTDELNVKLNFLNQKMKAQDDIIENLNREYEESVRLKGKDSEETRKAYVELLKAQTEQAKFAREIRETNKAISEQARELEKMTAKVTEVAKKYREDLAKSAQEYQKKVSDVNSKLADEERKLTESYYKELDSRTKAIRDFVGIFDKVERKDVSGKELLENLVGQVEAMKDFDKFIGQLASRGISGSLLETLKGMGAKSVDQIKALTTLSDAELREYVKLWEQKSSMARNEATQELEGLRAETQHKISQLRMEASYQLAQYAQEWESKQREIRESVKKELEKMIEDAQKSGQDMVKKLAKAIETAIPELKGAFAGLLGGGEGQGDQVKNAQTTKDGVLQATKEQSEGIKTMTSDTTKTVLDTWVQTGSTLVSKTTEIKDQTLAIWSENQTRLSALWTKMFTEAKTTWSEMQKFILDVTGTIEQRFVKLVNTAHSWGVGLMSEFIRGIRSQFGRLLDVLIDMTSMVNSYMPHSPAKVGPLSTLDETGPGLVDEFAKGIKKSLPQLEAVTREMASLTATKMRITPKAYDGTSNVGGGGTVLSVTINGNNADEIWEKFERELARRGVRY